MSDSTFASNSETVSILKVTHLIDESPLEFKKTCRHIFSYLIKVAVLEVERMNPTHFDRRRFFFEILIIVSTIFYQFHFFKQQCYNLSFKKVN